jgi:hypothetical protein
MRTVFILSLLLLSVFRVAAQVQELQQLKLDLEKLAQFKLILSQMKQGYQTLQNGYNAVRDVSKINFDLHKSYLDGLLAVNPVVKQSPMVREISDSRVEVSKSFESAVVQFQKSGLISVSELAALRGKYDVCLTRLDDDVALLALVISSGKLRMSDAERMEVIDTVRADVAAQAAVVRAIVSEQVRVLSLRGQQKKDNGAVKKLIGLK